MVAPGVPAHSVSLLQYNLKHDETLENHDNLKPVWVNDVSCWFL